MPEEKKEKNRWLEAVTRLIALTQQGKLKWSVVGAAKTLNDDRRASAVFQTEFAGKRLQLYATSEKIEIQPYFSVSGIGQEKTREYTVRRAYLEFISPNGQPIWSYPVVEGLDDLLSVVQYHVAGVNDFLDDILKETEPLVS